MRRRLRQLKHAGRNVRLDRGVEFRPPERVSIGDDTQLRTGVILQPGRHEITIGNRCGVNPYVCIYGKVDIGDFAMIAPHVMIAGGNHAFDDTTQPMILQGRGTNRGVVIENDVWLGANAVVTDGCRVGTGAVVGAGAVVTHDVQPYEIVAGSPARPIGRRPRSDAASAPPSDPPPTPEPQP